MRLFTIHGRRLTASELSMQELLDAIEMLAAFDGSAIVVVVSGQDAGPGPTDDDARQVPIDREPEPESDAEMDALFDAAERALGLRLR
jgi:hypothetical protein